MHAEEWIAQHGRYMRTIGMTELRKKLGRKKHECTWCGVYKPGLNRWCSRACNDEGYLRNGMAVKQLVYQRDQGICALCGVDTDSIRKRLKAAQSRAKRYAYDEKGQPFRRKSIYWILPLLDRIAEQHLSTSFHGTPYEIDHVIPVIEGGGLCGLDGFRTLCIPCHKAETKALARRRKLQREREKQPLLESQ